VEYRQRHTAKKWVWMEAKVSFFIDEENAKPHLLIVSRDIEERKVLQEELKSLAYRDELTGLPNRRLFEGKIQQTIREAKRHHQKFAVLLMDIDKFKWVNDTLGHSVGDELLKLFGKRVSKCLRSGDIFARIGGDEFTILLQDISDEDEAKKCAKRILASLQQQWKIGENTFNTTSSIGIACYPIHGENLEGIMKNADEALYKAKESGRNTYHIFS